MSRLSLAALVASVLAGMSLAAPGSSQLHAAGTIIGNGKAATKVADSGCVGPRRVAETGCVGPQRVADSGCVGPQRAAEGGTNGGPKRVAESGCVGPQRMTIA